MPDASRGIKISSLRLPSPPEPGLTSVTISPHSTGIELVGFDQPKVRSFAVYDGCFSDLMVTILGDSPLMGRLFIVRHGETPWNAEGRLQGHADIDLSEKGRQQAVAVAKRMADIPIDVAYCSDLARARHTAEIALEYRDVPLRSTEGLRERYYGVFEGLTMEERRAKFPDEFAASLVKDLDFAAPGGESARGMLARMTPVMSEIKERHLDETVLIVGHGGSLRSAVIALMAFPPEATWSFVMANCSLTVIDTFADNSVLRLYNDTSHLGGSDFGLWLGNQQPFCADGTSRNRQT